MSKPNHAMRLAVLLIESMTERGGRSSAKAPSSIGQMAGCLLMVDLVDMSVYYHSRLSWIIIGWERDPVQQQLGSAGFIGRNDVIWGLAIKPQQE
ncbi:hypothetical protein ACC702_23820 [Rhizobium ruizarguesonis]